MSQPPEKDPNDISHLLSEKQRIVCGIIVLLAPFIALFSIGHAIYRGISAVQEWHRREDQTLLAQQRHPQLTAQFAAFEQCVGRWRFSPPSDAKWLKCDMEQLRSAIRLGQGEDYVRFMVDRDRQLEAHDVDIYRLPGPPDDE